MKLTSTYIRAVVFLCALLFAPATSAQTKPQKPEEQNDVIRVSTELVQTDVMVLDKQGHFVDGLKSDQFAFKVDNKPTAITFFERVTSGKQGTERNPAANSAAGSNPNTPGPVITRGRSVFFFVDDLHLAPDSLVRTRKALLEFINRGMSETDQVAITSSSGQIGFLQQLTDDRVALRSAVARLSYRGNSKPDTDNPPMSEYVAMKIRDGDEQALTYYVLELQKQNCFKNAGAVICMMSNQAMRQAVRERAFELVTTTAPDTDNTLILLEGLMRTAGQLPGRKLVFMISDGFYLNDKQRGSLGRIKRITDAAGRAGVVIYTLDARGIISEALDVTNNRPLDAEGMASSLGE